MYLKAAFTLFLSAAQVSAFFVTPNGVMKRPFVPLKVSLSDPSSGTEVEGSEEPEAIVEETAQVSTEEVTSEADTDSSEASPKTMKGTERFTLYVGNLPFCKIFPAWPTSPPSLIGFGNSLFISSFVLYF